MSAAGFDRGADVIDRGPVIGGQGRRLAVAAEPVCGLEPDEQQLALADGAVAGLESASERDADPLEVELHCLALTG